MTDTTSAAGSHYAASLERASGIRAWSLGWIKGLMLAAAATVGWVDQPAVGDLVVRRVADGSEAIRTNAGDQEAAALLLHHVRAQLADLDVAAFEDVWGLNETGETERTRR